MLSNRFWGLKVALAAAAFAALCHWSDLRLRSTLPPVESWSDSHLGRTVHLSAQKVGASDPDWIEVLTSDGPIRILGQSTPAARPGDVLSAVGTVAGPRQVRAVRVRVHTGYAWKRPLNYAVSILTLIVFAVWAAPLFRGRFHDLLLRSRH